MPQRRLLTPPPSSPQVDLPTEGQDTWLDELMHRAGVATGLGQQRPHDAGDALAALLPTLIGAAGMASAKLPSNLGDQALRLHLLDPEFAPIGGEAAVNAARPVQLAADPTEAIYQRMLTQGTKRLPVPTAKARFAFNQDDFEGGQIPMFHIEGGTHDKSTVSAETLRKLGIPVPGEKE